MALAPHRSWVLKASLILLAVLVFSAIPTDSAGSASSGASSAEATYTTYSVGHSGKSIVRQARYYVRKQVPYNKVTWSCADFTRASVGNSIGVWMPDWDDKQLAYGRPTANLKDPLKRGDLVFFREHGGNGPVTHTSIYAGGGYVLHSSAYWGTSTRTYMPYITNNKGLPAYKPRYTRRVR